MQTVKTMRTLINLLEKRNCKFGLTECTRGLQLEGCDCCHGELDEAGAGPSRIIQHIHDGQMFIMISAMRGALRHGENLRRTAQLRRMLQGLPLSFIETEGEYQEQGRAEPSPEKSFFVMPQRAKHRISADAFRDLGIKMMHTFDQDSILFGDGKLATLIFDNGDTMDLGDTATFRPEVIDTLGGFSKIKGRKFSFTDAPTAARAVAKSAATEPAKPGGVTYGRDARTQYAA